MQSPKFLRPLDFYWHCRLWSVFGLILLIGCTDTNGANRMKIKDFYTDPQVLELIKAAEKNNLSRVKQLVKEGADPNTFGKEGMTPLMWVLGHQNKKAMMTLLAVGADPNLKQKEKESPMSLAAGAKDTEYMKILLEGGGNPDTRNRLDEPILFVALGQRRLDNIKMLLEYGADINATDKTVTTTIINAAAFNQYEIVHYLLEKGADHKHLAKDNASLAWRVQNGKVDRQFEAYQWREKVIKILEDRGIKFPVPHPAKMNSSAQ